MKHPNLIDTHCHLNFHTFEIDSEEVIVRAQEKNVLMLNVGTNFATSKRSIEIAEKTEGMWAAIGLHPIHLAKDITETAKFDGEEYAFKTKAEVFDKRKFFELAQSESVVAVGESGLDYYHLDDFKHPEMTPAEYVNLQKETLYEILGFAREINKPHIFHCRDAYDDFLDMIRQFGENSDGGSARAGVDGVVHCFTGTMQQAEKILETDLYIGFTGIVTFPNAQDLQEIAKMVPLERMLLETDSPYLAPQAVRGKRNEPAYVLYVAKKIAELKGITTEEVAFQTRKNANRLFQLGLNI